MPGSGVLVQGGVEKLERVLCPVEMDPSPHEEIQGSWTYYS